MGDIAVGPEVPQKEFKGYDILTEVLIPILQALAVIVAVDIVAGLVVFLAIQAGPATLQVMLGVPTLLGIPFVAFGKRRDDMRWAVAVIMVGMFLLTAMVVGLQQAAAVWPWEWTWEPWLYTSWLGVLVGLGVLIWRFANEVRDPWWPRLKESPAGKESPKVVDRPVYINTWNGKKRELVEAGPASEEPAYTLQDDLRSFVTEAYARGLARSDWIKPNQPRIKLWPSGQRVTRPYFDRLVGILREANIVAWDGSGSAATFNCGLDEALACLDGQQAGGREAGRQAAGAGMPGVEG